MEVLSGTGFRCVSQKHHLSEGIYLSSVGLRQRDMVMATMKKRKLISISKSFDSRGDTQEYSDLAKLAKRFLKGGKEAMEEGKEMPTKACIKEVVKELQKGEEGECPICLEAFEDEVLTPCAHRLCRECLLSSWRTPIQAFVLYKDSEQTGTNYSTN